ncbi:MAG TPA: hypothetical protein DD614_01530 [Clostridiales bacterium]|nr:hypothetical protein [Clostridiales bacterium]
MGKTISTNQTSLILVIFTIALKLSVLPAITCDFSSTSAYMVVLFACVIDFLLTIAIIIIMQKIPEKNFFGLIKETLSKPVAIIVYIFLFGYFFLKLLITLLELHDYYIVTLFEHLNPFFFILALMSLLLYLFKAEFRAIGRMIEICFWPLALGIIFTLVYPLGEVELVNLFPLFEDGIYPVMNGLLRTSFAYGDFMILFVLMGNISYSKHARKKVLLYMSAVLGFIFNFYIIFVGTFGDTAVNQSLALSELPLHNPYPTTIGRLEWLTIIMWSAILLIQVALLGISCTTCFKEIFGFSDRKIPTCVIILILSVLYIPTYLKLDKVVAFSTSISFSIISKCFEILCVIILYTSYFLIAKKKKPFETNFKVGRGNDKHSKKALSQ